MTAQLKRAQAVVDGDKPAKKVRFVKTTGQRVTLDEASLERAEALVGLQGYVTNNTAAVMPACGLPDRGHGPLDPNEDRR